MKKLMFLTSLLVLSTSCVDTVEAELPTNNQQSSKITPPTWIQGTWKYEEPHYSYYYRLTSNNICLVTAASETCMKEYIELYLGTNVTTNVEQKITDSEYYCKVSVQGTSNIYHFQNVSNNTIKDVVMSDLTGSTVLLKRD